MIGIVPLYLIITLLLFSNLFRTVIGSLITEQIFVDKPNAVDVMLEIVKIK